MQHHGTLNHPYKAQEHQSSKFSTYPLRRSASKGAHALSEAVLKAGVDFHYTQLLWKALLRVYIHEVKVKTAKDKDLGFNLPESYLIQ